MVYLLHFDKPYKHARHYLGYCEPGHLEERIERHRAGNGARLVAVVTAAGIGFSLARVWEDADRVFERRLKRTKHVGRYCPVCRALEKAAQDGQQVARG